MTATQTALTAAGTRTSGSSKWRLARRNPNADDFIDVSIAVVRCIVCADAMTGGGRTREGSSISTSTVSGHYQERDKGEGKEKGEEGGKPG